jgi:tripeptide aminopeptidase
MIDIPASILTQLLDLTCTIQSIPAPTFNEGQRADFFLKRIEEAGLQDIETDSAGNVFGRLPGRGEARPLVISAHMDTVYPIHTPLTHQRDEDRITGPGIGDNALGLASVLMLLKLLEMEEVRLPGDLWVAFNTCEEGLGDLRGMQAVVERFGSLPLAYLVVEGMGLGTVLNRGLGVERYKISVTTPGGHSWVDYGRPSAIHEISGIITRLTAISLPKKPCTTMNVGVISGGTSINTIAAHAWMELDLRSEDQFALSKLVRDVHAVALSAQRPGVQVKLERIGKRHAGQIDDNHALVTMARGVLIDLGLEPHLDIASTDANLPLSRGYPAICVGISYGNKAHTQDEFILTAPAASGLQQIYLLVNRVWDVRT